MNDLLTIRKINDEHTWRALRRSEKRGERTHEETIDQAASLVDWLGTDWSENPFRRQSFTGAELDTYRKQYQEAKDNR